MPVSSPSPTEQLAVVEQSLCARAAKTGHVCVSKDELDTLLTWSWEGVKLTERRTAFMEALAKMPIHG